LQIDFEKPKISVRLNMGNQKAKPIDEHGLNSRIVERCEYNGPKGEKEGADLTTR
jgi:hypothetical protein